ncbi:MAG: hypothetical protein Q9208_006486 [Pyrenodesmia sp. 3 TL-2023]
MLHYLVTCIIISALLSLTISPPPPPRPPRNPVYAPKCWASHPTVRPAVFAECRDIIRRLPTSMPQFEANQPLKFSTDPSFRPDIQLPVVWKQPGNVNCDVGLQFKTGAMGYDRTTLLDVQAAAMVAALECVIRPPHLGGVVEVGWQGRMAVNVLNLVVDEMDVRGRGSGRRNGTVEVE